MNKVSRLLGTAALATSLALGGSALTAGAAFADSGNAHSSYSNDRADHRDKNDRRDRGDHRDKNDRRDRHNNYRYFYRCYDRHDHEWYSFWSNRYEYKRNCHVYVVRHR